MGVQADHAPYMCDAGMQTDRMGIGTDRYLEPARSSIGIYNPPEMEPKLASSAWPLQDIFFGGDRRGSSRQPTEPQSHGSGDSSSDVARRVRDKMERHRRRLLVSSRKRG